MTHHLERHPRLEKHGEVPNLMRELVTKHSNTCGYTYVNSQSINHLGTPQISSKCILCWNWNKVFTVCGRVRKNSVASFLIKYLNSCKLILWVFKKKTLWVRGQFSIKEKTYLTTCRRQMQRRWLVRRPDYVSRRRI